MGRPLFELRISETDETSVEAIALVDRPAMELNYQMFTAEQQFKITDEDKQIISGFAIAVDKRIPREGGFDVIFPRETVDKIVQKFFRQKSNDQVNLMHNSNDMVDNAFVFESFQIDKARGILTPKGTPEQADGSWFISMKIDNKEDWEEFKRTGIYKGFSVQGIFEQVQIEFNKEDMSAEKTTLLQELLNKMNTYLNKFSKKEEMGEHDPEEDRRREEEKRKKEEEMGQVTLQNGDILSYDGTLEIGTTVRIISAEGEGELAAPNGEHETADGTMIIVTTDSIVTDIQTKLEDIPVDDEVMSDLLGKQIGKMKEELAASKLAETSAQEKIKELETSNAKFKDDFEEQSTQLDKVTSERDDGIETLKETQKTITELQKQEGQAPIEIPSGKPSWYTLKDDNLK